MENLILVQAVTLIAFICFNWFSQFILTKFGIQISFSHSDYKLSLRDNKNLLFELVVLICGIALIIDSIYIADKIIYPMMLAGVLISLVAAFSRFLRNNVIMLFHNICAIGGFVIAVLSIAWIDIRYLIISVIALGITLTYFFTSEDSNTKDWNSEQILVNLLIIEIFTVTWIEMLKM